MGIALAVCSIGLAQDAGTERVVVPARNSTHPRKVIVNIMGGPITVKAYNGREVIVETQGGSGTSRGDRREDRRADGMKRLDLPQRGLSVEEDDNVVTVKMEHGLRGSGVTISTPAETALSLHTMSGEITVEGVKGEIDVNSMNGRINLTNVSGSVLAHSMNGPMKVVMDNVDASKPLSFSTMNGTIDVTLPANFKANAKIRTDHGEVYSDFDFKLNGGAITQKNDTSDGKFRVTMDKTITGTINGGGAEVTLKTYNGTIYLRKGK
jgi:hypothetical protein